jgi:hypothetical protein
MVGCHELLAVVSGVTSFSLSISLVCKNLNGALYHHLAPCDRDGFHTLTRQGLALVYEL